MTLRALVSGTTCLLNLTQRSSLRAQPLVGVQWRTHGRMTLDRATRQVAEMLKEAAQK